MTLQIPSVRPNDWTRLRIIIDKLKYLRLGIGSHPTFAGLTLSAGPLDLSGKLTVGSFASPIDVTATREYGFELHYSGNNYNATAIRARAHAVTTDTSAQFQGGLFQAANNDDVSVGVLNGLVAEAIGKATTNAATITMMRGCLVNTEWSAKDTVTDLRVLHVRTHTRDAATEGYVSGTGYGIYIENEAVGGNGQALDAGIYFKGTNLSAGNKAFTYGIDFSGATYGTADIQLSDGSVINKDGKWGVRTATPGAELEVNGNTLFGTSGTPAKQILVGVAATFPGIWFGAASASPTTSNYAFLYVPSTDATLLNTPPGGTFEFSIGNSRELYVHSTGIGLVANALLSFTGPIAPSSANYALVGTSTYTLLNVPTGGAVSLRVGNLTKMHIDSTGNMGFGEGSLGFGETIPETLAEWTSTVPYLTLHNFTHEDTDGGRESRLNFKGEQGVDPFEETTLARIEVGHDGSGADDKGYFDIFINDGDDGDSPTHAIRVNSVGVGVGTKTQVSLLEADGALGLAIETVTGNTTLDATHSTVLVNASGNITITLPTAASAYNSTDGIGRIYEIKKIDADADTVTVDGNGSETIDGGITAVLTVQYESITIQSDGSNWHII